MVKKPAYKIGVFLNFYTNRLADWEKQFKILNQLSGVDCVELLIEEIDLPLKNINFLNKRLGKYEKLLHAPFIGPTFISPQIELQKAAVRILHKTIVLAKEINARVITTHVGIIGAFYDHKYLQSHLSLQYQKLINEKNALPIITIENLPKKLGFIRSYPSLAEINSDEMWQNCNLTLDIGHAILDKSNYLKFLKSHLPRVKNIHLHNVVNGKEHQSIAKRGGLKLNELFVTLNKFDYRGFVNLEIPARQDLIDSWNYLQKQI